MRRTTKTVAFMAAGAAAWMMTTTDSLAQRVVTDEFGTEFLIDVLPPDTQRKVVETQNSIEMGGEGPLKVQGGSVVLAPESPRGVSDAPLVDNLRGIVIVPTPGDVRADGWPGVEGIWHDYDDFPQKVGDVLTSYLGSSVSLASLDEMIKATIRAYRNSDRPVVDVLLPEQDITSGVVQLVVVEGKLNRIRVEGVDAKTEEYLRGQVDLEKGQVINNRDVLRNLNWLNRSPYRKVDLVYAPGYEFGTTDIILNTIESDPTFFYMGYEDSGTEALGRSRWLAGFNWGDAFGPDQGLSYQYTTSDDFSTVQAHSGAYMASLPWQHYLTIAGSYATVDSGTEAGGTTLQSGGKNVQGSGRYSIPMAAFKSQTHELQLGFDFKSTNNNLAFGGDEVFDTTTEIFQLSMGYNILAQDRWGVTKADIVGYYSPGGVDGNNSDEAFQETRNGASSQYAYGTLGIERQQRLPENWTLRMRGQGQISDGNLLASEQLGIGGYDTIRGFDNRLVRGDQGFWGTVEIFTPATSVGRFMKWKNETDELRFLGFFDYGNVGNKHRLEDEPSSFQMSSVGAGLRWRYSDWFRVRLDYGYPVSTKNLDGLDSGGRIHIGATANF
ncbi:MAG: ShlB/FhaC/HecB family hemolysin secretion/activation protein [Verrucomicrobiota bacterium]